LEFSSFGLVDTRHVCRNAMPGENINVLWK